MSSSRSRLLTPDWRQPKSGGLQIAKKRIARKVAVLVKPLRPYPVARCQNLVRESRMAHNQARVRCILDHAYEQIAIGLALGKTSDAAKFAVRGDPGRVSAPREPAPHHAEPKQLHRRRHPYQSSTTRRVQHAHRH